MAVTPRLPPSLNELASYIAGLESRIQMLERNQRVSQLGNSSIENGTLLINDANQNPVLSLGVQQDGSFSLVSNSVSVPAAPSDPVVTPGPLALTVAWNGTMTDGSNPLADLDVVQIFCSTASGFLPTAATYQGTLASAGTFTIAGLSAGVTYYVVLVAVNEAGNASATSDYIPGTPLQITPSQISALTASLIGNIGTLNANPYFLGGDPTGWAGFNGTFSVTASPPAGAPYAYAGEFTQTSGTGAMEESAVPFAAVPNTNYLVTAWIYSTTSQAIVGFDWLTGIGGTYVSTTTQTFTVTPNTWTQVTTVQESAGTAGAGYARLSPNASGGTIYAAGILVMPQVPGSLIQAGTITATQLAAGIVYAGIVNSTVISAATFLGTDSIINPSGLFFYNGTPATGNDPFFVVAANGTTVDPEGNGVAPGVSSFDQSASLTVQIYQGAINFNYIFGTFKTINANADLQYGGTGAALGTLIGSDAANAGTDQYGNAFLAGRTGYALVSGTYVATNQNGGVFSIWTASAPGGPYTEQATLTLGPGGTTSVQTTVPLTFTNFTGTLPTTVSTILSNSIGEMQAVNALDGQRYNITHHTAYTTVGSGGQSFNTTSPVAIPGLSASLGAGNYEVTVRVFGTCPNSGGSHTFTFAFTGTATGVVNAILWQPQAANAAPTQSTLMNVTPFTSGLTSPPQTNTGAWADIYAILTVTAAGTLTLNCQVSNTGDPYTVEQGSYMRILPT